MNALDRIGFRLGTPEPNTLAHRLAAAVDELESAGIWARIDFTEHTPDDALRATTHLCPRGMVPAVALLVDAYWHDQDQLRWSVDRAVESLTWSYAAVNCGTWMQTVFKSHGFRVTWSGSPRDRVDVHLDGSR